MTLAWDVARLLGWTLIIFVLLSIIVAHAKTPCQQQPGDLTLGPWAYRTQVDGRPDRCWYQGERMRDRAKLYWQTEQSWQAPIDEDPPPPMPFDEFKHRWEGMDDTPWLHEYRPASQWRMW